MTRDGAVLDNQTTGAEIHISERDAEKQLSPDRQPVQMGKRDAPMNPAEDAPKHGRQLRPQEQKEPEKEQPKPQQPSAEPFQPQGGSPVSNIPQDIPTSAAPGGTAEKFFDRAAAEHDAHKARQTARMSRDAAQQRYSASRLQFPRKNALRRSCTSISTVRKRPPTSWMRHRQRSPRNGCCARSVSLMKPAAQPRPSCALIPWISPRPS